MDEQQIKALRIMDDLLCYGNSAAPNENMRHKTHGFVSFNQASFSSTILQTEPPQLKIIWHGDNHLRPEEVGRQVFETLCKRSMGATYDHYTKTLMLTLGPAIYEALDKLDTDLEPLRTAAPAVTIGTPTPPTDGKVMRPDGPTILPG